MSNHIRISMAGYLDENDTIMSRTELNKRISGMQDQLEKAEKVIEDCLYTTAMRDPAINTHKQAGDHIEEIAKKYINEKTTS
jgi:hypothetical protein